MIACFVYGLGGGGGGGGGGDCYICVTCNTVWYLIFPSALYW